MGNFSDFHWVLACGALCFSRFFHQTGPTWLDSWTLLQNVTAHPVVFILLQVVLSVLRSDLILDLLEHHIDCKKVWSCPIALPNSPPMRLGLDFNLPCVSCNLVGIYSRLFTSRVHRCPRQWTTRSSFFLCDCPYFCLCFCSANHVWKWTLKCHDDALNSRALFHGLHNEFAATQQWHQIVGLERSSGKHICSSGWRGRPRQVQDWLCQDLATAEADSTENCDSELRSNWLKSFSSKSSPFSFGNS